MNSRLSLSVIRHKVDGLCEIISYIATILYSLLAKVCTLIWLYAIRTDQTRICMKSQNNPERCYAIVSIISGNFDAHIVIYSFTYLDFADFVAFFSRVVTVLQEKYLAPKRHRRGSTNREYLVFLLQFSDVIPSNEDNFLSKQCYSMHSWHATLPPVASSVCISLNGSMYVCIILRRWLPGLAATRWPWSIKLVCIQPITENV